MDCFKFSNEDNYVAIVSVVMTLHNYIAWTLNFKLQAGFWVRIRAVPHKICAH